MSDLFESKSVKPMLIAEESPAFDSPGWLYELKLDGVRCIAYLDMSGGVFRNKRNKDVTAIYPELGAVHMQAKNRCILDGEAIYVNEINTIPGSLSFYLWEATGLGFGALMDTLISRSLKRERDKSHKTVSYSENIFSMGSFPCSAKGGVDGSKLPGKK